MTDGAPEPDAEVQESRELDQIAGLWQEGLDRLGQLPTAQRRSAEAVIDALVAELQRRVGARFMSAELARYYLEHSTDWCFEIAVRVAPGEPEAWDMTTVASAAFARYLRRASDQGGGRRQLEDR